MAKNSKRMIGIVVASIVFATGIAGYYGVMLFGDAPKDSFVSPGENVNPITNLDLEKAVVVIQTARGKIKFKFYPKDAPKTSARVAELIQKGFYNGIVFHRVVPGFVVQGGDPTGSGMGGSGQTLPAEFNTQKHVPGTVAMARSADPNSADSQFYITLGTHPHLDGQYTVFGHVIEGLEVANQIQVGDRMTSVTLEKEP